MYTIYFIQNSMEWRAVLNTVINLQVQYTEGNFLTVLRVENGSLDSLISIPMYVFMSASNLKHYRYVRFCFVLLVTCSYSYFQQEFLFRMLDDTFIIL